MKQSLVRDNIVKIASHLFYHKGYNLTGINEIIREAGIAKATLYNHFKSKEDICLAYLEFKNSTFLKNIEAFCINLPRGEKQILGLFDFLKMFFKNKDFNGCWCINTVSEIPKENKKIRVEIQKQKQEFISLIEQLIQQNFLNLSSDEKEILSKKIYLLYESAVSESHLHQALWPIDTAKNLCKMLISKIELPSKDN